MKKYVVHWDERVPQRQKINAKSPEEAYGKFLESEIQTKNVTVFVSWGFFGFKIFKEHLEEQKTQQATATNSLAIQRGELEEHKYSLRENTAYSRLRSFLRISAALTAVACVIFGVVLLNENNKEVGVLLLLFGPLVAALEYFIASVYFDIADAGLNTSMRTQDLHRMESSKETASMTGQSCSATPTKTAN